MANFGSSFTNAISNKNCTLLVDGVEATGGTDEWGQPLPPSVNSGQTIGIEAPSGFIITEMIAYDAFSTPYTFTIVNDGALAEWVFNGDSDTINSAPSLTTQEQVSAAEFELGYNFYNPLMAECDVFIDSEPLVIETDGFGQPINPTVLEGETIRVLPPEGYKIVEIYFSDVWNQPFEFEIINDGQEATFLIDSTFGDDEKNTASTSVTLEISTPTEVVGGSNKNYVVTPEIIRQVNDERISYSSGTSGEPSSVDYGSFILGIIELPTSLPSEFVLGEETIRLGDKTLTPTAPLLQSDKIAIDMGEISVPETYNDSRDFSGVLYNLHLPYVDSLNIEAFYIVGETIKIDYLIDLYNAEATIRLKSTKVNDEVFYSKRVKLGVDVPYSSTTIVSADVTNSNIGFVGDNGIKIPFIEKIDSVSLLNETFFSSKILDEGLLSDFTGYIEVEKVELNINCYSNEKEDLESILKTGVIINE